MNHYVCTGCGTDYYTSEPTPPPTPKWSDGHVCRLKLIEPLTLTKEEAKHWIQGKPRKL